MERPPSILISAGEASGDRLGAGLAGALRRRRPDLRLSGMGGPLMERAGVRLVQDAAEVTVVGFAEVVTHLPALHGAMRRLEQSLVEERPDLLVPVDFPDFNLRLAARARRAGVEVVYFVSPQIWAWRRGRVRRIRRLVRRMLVLFPFEIGFYEAAGVPVTFVGHPAAEAAAGTRDRGELCRRAGLDPARPILALVPGSRRMEIARLLAPMLAAARRVRERHPSMQFLVPVAPGVSRESVAGMVERAGIPDVHLHDGDFPEVLTVCTAGAVASGTASLEAAVAGLPICIVYRMSPLSYAIARTLVRLDHVGLPNLVLGSRVVPELIQAECTPERIAAELLRYVESPAEAERVRRALAEVRDRLGGAGVFERAAERLLLDLDAARAARAGR
jgi:lipid-A-disaccharide synthase